MRATDFGSGSGGYKFGGLQDSGGYKFGGLQDYALRILGLPAHEPVRGATRFGGLQVRGATRLRATDFGSGDARTSSGGYKIRGATRFGGLQDYALRILGPPDHEPVLEEL